MEGIKIWVYEKTFIYEENLYKLRVPNNITLPFEIYYKDGNVINENGDLVKACQLSYAQEKSNLKSFVECDDEFIIVYPYVFKKLLMPPIRAYNAPAKVANRENNNIYFFIPRVVCEEFLNTKKITCTHCFNKNLPESFNNASAIHFKQEEEMNLLKKYFQTIFYYEDSFSTSFYTSEGRMLRDYKFDPDDLINYIAPAIQNTQRTLKSCISTMNILVDKMCAMEEKGVLIEEYIKVLENKMCDMEKKGVLIEEYIKVQENKIDNF